MDYPWTSSNKNIDYTEVKPEGIKLVERRGKSSEKNYPASSLTL